LVFTLKSTELDFPDGTVDNNLPANAGDRLDFWSKKIPHVVGQLSLCPTTTESTLWSPHAPTTEAHCVPSLLSNFRTLSLSSKETQYPLATTSNFSILTSPRKPLVYFVSLDFPIPDIL